VDGILKVTKAIHRNHSMSTDNPIDSLVAHLLSSTSEEAGGEDADYYCRDDDDDDDDEFHDALNFSQFATPIRAAAMTTTAPGCELVVHSSSSSYYGTASPLSTGTLFPSGRGVVDRLPPPPARRRDDHDDDDDDEEEGRGDDNDDGDENSGSCTLLFADHDPISAMSHICLMEKEGTITTTAATEAAASSFVPRGGRPSRSSTRACHCAATAIPARGCSSRWGGG
jgi:hypothetical protein